ncbi:hypothetical protein [Sphingomonas sp.]|uniref:hypothetical protein n=1 Tax=Sphingomonas sp. TaxID=28214 RepID=UPI0035C84BB0
MPMIEIDFETFKEITRRRPSESVSEGDVVREALGLTRSEEPDAVTNATFWESEGVQFEVGSKLEHRFRDGRIVEATITDHGVEMNGVVYSGLSPAGVAVAGHQLNGWLFWFLRDEAGKLVSADTLRKR